MSCNNIALMSLCPSKVLEGIRTRITEQNKIESNVFFIGQKVNFFQKMDFPKVSRLFQDICLNNKN
jgi:hypothetical protein